MAKSTLTDHGKITTSGSQLINIMEVPTAHLRLVPLNDKMVCQMKAKITNFDTPNNMLLTSVYHKQSEKHL